eukprot:scaffold104674_cov60-Attheya_sp.AAC.1
MPAPRPTPPRTGDLCLRHSGGYIVVLSYCRIVVLSYRVSWWRDVKRLSYVHRWAVAVGHVFFPVVVVGYKARKRSFEHVAYHSSTLQRGTRSDRVTFTCTVAVG